MSPTGVQTIVGSWPKQESYIIDSIFERGEADFDTNIAFININDLENLFDLKKSERFLEVYLKNPQKIDIAKKELGKVKNEKR